MMMHGTQGFGDHHHAGQQHHHPPPGARAWGSMMHHGPQSLGTFGGPSGGAVGMGGDLGLMVSAVAIGPGHHDQHHAPHGHGHHGGHHGGSHGRRSGSKGHGNEQQPISGVHGHGQGRQSGEHPRQRFSMVRKSLKRSLVIHTDNREAHSLNDLIVGDDGDDDRK